MNCETCKEKKMQAEPVPYIVHESAMARAERANKRLWIALILAIVLLVGSNIGWMIYESQFVDETTTVEQEVDTGEGDAFVAGVGDVIYGESKAESNDKIP